MKAASQCQYFVSFSGDRLRAVSLLLENPQGKNVRDSYSATFSPADFRAKERLLAVRQKMEKIYTVMSAFSKN